MVAIGRVNYEEDVEKRKKLGVNTKSNDWWWWINDFVYIPALCELSPDYLSLFV